jgi:alanyl-tRNA synthetase
MIERGITASQLVKIAAQTCGGGGGGKPQFAQAGGKDPSRLPQALLQAKSWVSGLS